MPSPEPFRIFTRKLENLGLRYMVSGSVASIYYGEPRLTNDVDLIVRLTQEDVARIEEAFPLDQFYCPPREVISLELAREQRATSTSFTTKPGSRRMSTSWEAMTCTWGPCPVPSQSNSMVMSSGLRLRYTS